MNINRIELYRTGEYYVIRDGLWWQVWRDGLDEAPVDEFALYTSAVKEAIRRSKCTLAVIFEDL